jgi:hypothetical protein
MMVFILAKVCRRGHFLLPLDCTLFSVYCGVFLHLHNPNFHIISHVAISGISP